MTTSITTNATYSQMHNNIMAAGSRDRSPMLATGRCAQWQSRFMRYVDTKPNGEALRKCIIQGPYKLSNIIIPGQPATDESLLVLEQTIHETLSNITPKNKAHYDAAKRTHDMWIAIERLQQGESLNKQDVNTDTCYQEPKPHKSYAPPSKQSSSTRSHVSTRHKGNEIAKPITLPSESASEEDNDPEQAWRDKEMQKNLALIAKTVTVAGIQCFNYKEFGHFAKECRKSKRVKDYTYHKEKMLLCKQAEKGVPLQAEQDDWLEDMDEEVDKQELEAHYSFMAKIQEVLPADSGSDAEPLEKVQYAADYNVFANERQHFEQPESINDTYVVEKDDSNVIHDSSNMCDNDNQADQNAKECDDERVVLVALIVNLQLDTEENKKIQKTLGKSNRTRDRYLVALHDKDVELAKYKTFKDHTIKNDTLEHLQYVQSLEKEIDELESDKADFSNIYDLLLQECVSKDVMCSYLHSLSDLDAHTELQCLYIHKIKECECLAEKLSKQTKNVSKEVYNELLRSFAKLEQHLISLKIDLQQCQEQIKNDTVCKQNGSTVFLKEREQYFEIQDLKAQLHDKNIAISELNKLIKKMKGKTMDTKFDKPSIVRQPNAQSIPKPSVLGAIHITCVSRPQLRSTQMKEKIVQLILFIVDSVFTKHMTGNLKLLYNLDEKYLGTVRLEMINLLQFLVMGICWFCDADLEVAFRKSTCFVRDLQGNDLLLDIVIVLPKLKYVKDQLCSSCELGKAKRSTFKTKIVPSLKGRLNLLHMDFCGPMRIESINGKEYILRHRVLKQDTSGYFKEEGIEHQTSTPRTLEQNGVVERQNRTLVEAARTMLSASKLPLFFWAEAIATACYTQNRSLIILRHEKTPYHIINGRKPSLKHLYIFGCTCYITRDGENLDKMKEKWDSCILVGYSSHSKGYKVYNTRTRLIVESIHINFDEIKELSKASDYDNSGPAPQLQMTSAHNRSELEFNDHDNEPSSSNIVPNVSPPTDTNAPSL
ncbi:retrovirus-related pol polyprotein from transposon TNT 1-94 [Tanacetum coccineum]